MTETKEHELDPALHDLEQALASRRWEAQMSQNQHSTTR